MLDGCTWKRRSAVNSTPLDLSVSTLRASWMERGGLPVIMPRISVIYEWMERGSLPVACITRSSKAGGGGGRGVLRWDKHLHMGILHRLSAWQWQQRSTRIAAAP